MFKNLKDIALHEKLLTTAELHVSRINHPILKVLSEGEYIWDTIHYGSLKWYKLENEKLVVDLRCNKLYPKAIIHLSHQVKNDGKVDKIEELTFGWKKLSF